MLVSFFELCVFVFYELELQLCCEIEVDLYCYRNKLRWRMKKTLRIRVLLYFWTLIKLGFSGISYTSDLGLPYAPLKKITV